MKWTKHKDLITNQNKDNYLAICGFKKQMEDKSWDWRVLILAFFKTFW